MSRNIEHMKPIFWWVPIFSTLRNHQTSIPHVHRVSDLFQALQEFLQRFLQVRFHLKQLWPSENVVYARMYIYIYTYIYTYIYIHTYIYMLFTYLCIYYLHIIQIIYMYVYIYIMYK